MVISNTGRRVVVAGRPAVQFDREFSASRDDVWRALTTSSDLSRWFPADLIGARAEGASLRIRSFTDRFSEAAGSINVYQEPNRFEYTWGEELLIWELTAKGEMVAVRFTNVVDDQAEEIGLVAIAASWHACLDLLGCFLEGEPAALTVDERFDDLSGQYEGAFRA